MTTKVCNVTTARYVRLIAGQLGRRWAWVAAVPLLTAVALSFSDVRFVIVALLILFVIVPLALMFIYIFFGLTPEARFSILRKRINVNSSRMTAEFESLGDDYPTPPTVKLDISRVTNVAFRKDCYVVTIDHRRFRPILIPYSAFADRDEIAEFSRIIIPKQ